MRIRKIESRDIDRVKQLIDSNFSRPIKRSSLVDTIDDKHNPTFILTDDTDKLLATIGIRNGKRIAWLCTTEKRKGYATMLVKELIRLYGDILYLYVKTYNEPAINLYKRLGFYVAGTKTNDRNEVSYKMELR